MAMSETRDKTIHEAFIEAYAQMPDPRTNAENPAFKRGGKPMRYADLEAFLDVAKPILTACGFALIQTPINDEDERVGVHTWLLYKTGETMDFGSFTVPLTKPDPQGAGAALTYCRRYAVASIFGLAQEDDDANSASVTRAQSKSQPQAGTQKASDKQVSMIFALGRKLGWSEDETIATVRKSTGKEHPGDLEGGRGGEASRFIDALQERVKALEAREGTSQAVPESSPQAADEGYEEPPEWAEEIPF